MRILLSCWAGVWLSQSAALAAGAPEVKLIPQEKVIQVEIGGQPFTTYHFADDFIRPFVRPFLWPVRASDGTEVTIDQAQFKELHPHQRSIWIGHHNVNGADHWKFTAKPIVPKQRHLKFDKLEADGFDEELVWEDKDGKPMMDEARTLRFIAYPDGNRAINVTLKFTASEGDDVTFFSDSGDTGLCPVRLVPSISHEPQLANSTGGKGQEECDMKPAAWCDESGQIDKKTYGVAILDYPQNLRHPPLWHAHRDARLSTDIFSLHTFDKDKYPKGAGNFTIKRGQTSTFRYRIVVHTGDAAAADIAQKFKDFAAGK
jgi:hypothetical protein